MDNITTKERDTSKEKPVSNKNQKLQHQPEQQPTPHEGCSHQPCDVMR
jgi:hypothetical protein